MNKKRKLLIEIKKFVANQHCGAATRRDSTVPDNRSVADNRRADNLRLSAMTAARPRGAIAP